MTDRKWMTVQFFVLVLLISLPLGAQKTGKTRAPETPPPASATVPSATTQAPMNFGRARQIILDTFHQKDRQYFEDSKAELKITQEKIVFSLVFSSDGLLHQSVLDLKTLPRFSVHPVEYRHQVNLQLFLDGKDPTGPGGICHWRLTNPMCLYVTWADPSAGGREAFGPYADALNWLAAHARGDDRAQIEAEWRDFQQKAALWRSAATHPPLSDEVRMHRLVAEDALNKKDFNKAIEEYEAGLKIEPLWPEGHYNAALLYGELEDYEDAAWHMRHYLELRPDAPDAAAARDQMLLWQGKAGMQ